jgi:endonuclease YncB( thermonuclease family)
MRRGLKAGLAALGAVVACGAAGQEPAPAPAPEAARSPVCEPRRSQDRIEALTERGEIRLASGRIAKLAGIRLAEEPAHAQAGADWLRSFHGSPVEVAALAGEPDRWGRLAAILTVPSDAGPIDLNRGLVAAGLAMVDAGEADRLCQPELLGAEARARELRLGLWRSDRYKPVAAADLETLRSRIGQFALVEGRIRSVGERSRRTYLNFGGDWKRRFHDHNSATNLVEHARARPLSRGLARQAGSGAGHDRGVAGPGDDHHGARNARNPDEVIPQRR